MSNCGTESGGRAADSKNSAFEVSKKVSGTAAACKNNALEVSTQSSVSMASCDDQFDFRSPTGMHNCIVVKSLRFSVHRDTSFNYHCLMLHCRPDVCGLKPSRSDSYTNNTLRGITR
eukprot:SAG31_NODE_22187_length_532_cov_0.508083_1_plen_116_part_10